MITALLGVEDATVVFDDEAGHEAAARGPIVLQIDHVACAVWHHCNDAIAPAEQGLQPGQPLRLDERAEGHSD